ncbi:hypothetical protein L2E82_05271 [Cichorium intybus]|uniref:Uncharacterized protein n=1 Tax=Cichorium intybus TaxID=13427 RepID=A0ACB9H6J4_CICIN|nr:hypothetical protein L2E82_05271 [Cichorium intybus]
MEKAGFGNDGVFRSLWPPLVIPAGPNTSMISFLFRNISSYANKPALLDSESGDTLTFSEFKTTVAKFSHALNHQLGITKNDVVLIFAPNSIQYPICSYSIIALGAIVTTVNPQCTTEELSKQIQESKPKLIITVQELYQNVENFGLPVLFLGSKSPGNGLLSYKDLISKSPPVSELPNVSIRGDDPAAILYSSGTFGVSKGVVLTHNNFIATSQMVTSDQRLMGEQDYVHLCFLPMFHIFAFAVILYSQLQEGNTIVSMGKFGFLDVQYNIMKYGVTHLWAVPHVILHLTKQTVTNKYHVSSLKQIISGGAPLGKGLIVECAKWFPGVFVLQIAPADLEARLLAHSNILDAAVIRFQDAEAGEVPIAFVVQLPNTYLTEEDVKRFIAKQVAPHLQLRQVIFVNKIPKSASGKLLRRVLAETVGSRMFKEVVEIEDEKGK